MCFFLVLRPSTPLSQCSSPKSRQQTTRKPKFQANRLRREAAGERGGKCLVRSTEKVTQLQGAPIDVGSVREGEGQETRCESTGGCERKQGRPAGDIRGGGTRAQERRGLPCSW